MKILATRPAPPGSGNVRARLDVELDNGVRLYDLKAKDGPGGMRLFGPQHYGGAAVTFPPVIADQIIALLEKAVADEQIRAA